MREGSEPSPSVRGLASYSAEVDATLQRIGHYRRVSPRFQGENFAKNLALVARIKSLASEKGCSASQLALAWVLAQGDDIVPIPGTKRRTYLKENLAALDVALTSADLAAIAMRLRPRAQPPACAIRK